MFVMMKSSIIKLISVLYIYTNAVNVIQFGSASSIETNENTQTLNNPTHLILFQSHTIDVRSQSHSFATLSIEDNFDDFKNSTKSQYLIHYKSDTGALSNDDRAKIEAILSQTLTNYIPFNTYIIYASIDQINQIKLQTKSIDWISTYKSVYKLHSSVYENLNSISTPNSDASIGRQLLSLNSYPDVKITNSSTTDDDPIGSDLNVWIVPSNWETTEKIAKDYTLGISSYLGMNISIVIRDIKKLHIKLPSSFYIPKVSEWLSSQPETQLVIRRPRAKIMNEWSKGLTENGILNPSYDDVGNSHELLSYQHELYGDNEIIGVADTGLDINSCYFFDPEMPKINYKRYQDARNENNEEDIIKIEPDDLKHRKVVQYVAFADTEDGSGHGTHCSATIAGAAPIGAKWASKFNGIAPRSKIAFFDMGIGPETDYPNLPDPLDKNLFPWAHKVGAKIHSNSWGTEFNAYTPESHEIDSYMYNHKDFLVIGAAGNSGMDGAGTVGAPFTAKNLITCGASMSPQIAWIGAFGDSGFQHSPRFVNDALADPELYNEESMACFSSRGPTIDGRVKPELVAPGVFVISARNAQNPRDSCYHPQVVRGLAGTSQATPIVAGLAALVRQYFLDGYYPPIQHRPLQKNGFNPSAALVKAILISSTQDMKGSIDASCSLKNTGVQPRPTRLTSPAPSNLQGWGRVQLSSALAFFGEESNLIIHRPENNHSGTKTDELGDPIISPGDLPHELEICVVGPLSNNQPTKVTLVWTDPPAQPNVQKVLINNLDLQVLIPSSSFLNLNDNQQQLDDDKVVLIGNSELTGGRPDDIHVIEQIRISKHSLKPRTTISVKVTGAHLINSQSYSLVITGKVRKGHCDQHQHLITDDNNNNDSDNDKYNENNDDITLSRIDDSVTSSTRPKIVDISVVSSLEGQNQTSIVIVSFKNEKSQSRHPLYSVAAKKLTKKSTNEIGDLIYATANKSPVTFTGLPNGLYLFSVVDQNSPTLSEDVNSLEWSNPVIVPKSQLKMKKPHLAKKRQTELEITTISQSIQLIHHSQTSINLVTLTFHSPHNADHYLVKVLPSTYSISTVTSPVTISNLTSGVYTFQVEAYDSHSRLIEVSDESEEITVLDNKGQVFSYYTEEWSKCSAICETGKKWRRVTCINSFGDEVDESFCQQFIHSKEKPHMEESCNTIECGKLTFDWSISAWSQCSKPCGDGIRTRNVTCESNTDIPVNEIFCSDHFKPITEEPCNAQPCPIEEEHRKNLISSDFGARWIIGDCLTNCSKSCGGGTCEREVTCMLGQLEVSDVFCEGNQSKIRPPKKGLCNVQPCLMIEDEKSKHHNWWKREEEEEDHNSINDEQDKYFEHETLSWIIGPWSSCSALCAGGIQHRTVECWSSRGYAEKESKCLQAAPTKLKPITQHFCANDPCSSSTSQKLINDNQNDGIEVEVDRNDRNQLLQGVPKMSDRKKIDDDKNSDNDDDDDDDDTNNPYWLVSDWSTTCDPVTKTQSRWVICTDNNGSHMLSIDCEALVGKKPKTTKLCSEELLNNQQQYNNHNDLLAIGQSKKIVHDQSIDPHNPLGLHFVSGEWSLPSKFCYNQYQIPLSKIATQTRMTFCLGGNGYVASSLSECESIGLKMPIEYRQVKLKPCQTSISDHLAAHWFTDEWSVCSSIKSPCNGTQHRQVYCVTSDGIKINDRSLCPQEKQPINVISPCRECKDETIKHVSYKIPIINSAQKDSKLYGSLFALSEPPKQSSSKAINSFSIFAISFVFVLTILFLQ